MAHPTPKRAPEEIAHDVEQETIHVPRGKSRARYVATIGLLIFILVIFVVSDLFTNVFRGGGVDGPYFTWRHPTDGVQEWSGADFQHESRRLDSVLRVLRQGRDVTDDFLDDENVARLIVLDRLARDAGVEVGNADLRKLLNEGGMIVLGLPSASQAKAFPAFVLQVQAPARDFQLYAEVLRQFRLTPVEFEEELRRLMRIERFESLMLLPSAPDPSAIEKAWRERHEEHRFEFVAVDVAAARAEADQETPDEAALRAWYEGLDLGRKRSAFAPEWLPERASAELLAWSYDSAQEPQALLEKYPRAPEADLEQLARDYHTQFKNVRFRRPEPKAEAASADERLYFTFDEVADQARRESKVHAALVEHASDLQRRIAAGEAVDLAAEAASLGLSYVQEKEPLSSADWSSHGSVGDPLLGSAVLRASRGDRFVALTVGSKAFVLGRAETRLESGPPAFDAIPARVAEEWKKDRAVELAKQKGQAVFDALRPAGPVAPDATPDEPVTAEADAFAAAAKAQGLDARTTEWIDRAKLRFEPDEAQDELQRFQNELSRMAGAALGYEEGQVGPPVVSGDKERVYVIRKAGQREPPEVAIEPGDYESLRSSLAFETLTADRERLFGIAALSTKFQVAFPARDEMRRKQQEAEEKKAREKEQAQAGQ